jgi:RNA polymerase sigma-70 factor (ECF subfamily)
MGEAERLAAAKALALLTSADVDAEQLDALMQEARDAGGSRSPRPVAPQPAEVRVWSVLTVDVVDGRIQTVRIVRNPDKLGHL